MSPSPKTRRGAATRKAGRKKVSAGAGASARRRAPAAKGAKAKKRAAVARKPAAKNRKPTSKNRKPASKKKSAGPRGVPATAPVVLESVQRPSPEEEAAYTDALIESGEAARLDEHGKLPRGVTHKIVEDETGHVTVVRRRFSIS